MLCVSSRRVSLNSWSLSSNWNKLAPVTNRTMTTTWKRKRRTDLTGKSRMAGMRMLQTVTRTASRRRRKKTPKSTRSLEDVSRRRCRWLGWQMAQKAGQMTRRMTRMRKTNQKTRMQWMMSRCWLWTRSLHRFSRNGELARRQMELVSLQYTEQHRLLPKLIIVPNSRIHTLQAASRRPRRCLPPQAAHQSPHPLVHSHTPPTVSEQFAN